MILDILDWVFYEVGIYISNKGFDVYLVRKGFILLCLYM